jgi:hypothetical protein
MNREDDFFLNFNKGVSFFIGVVENINDPAMLNRVQCRVFGIHPMDRSEVPTEALPWATVMMPTTSAGLQMGGGDGVMGLREGSWVLLFFFDGPSCQDPLILGTIPSLAASTELASTIIPQSGTPSSTQTSTTTQETSSSTITLSPFDRFLSFLKGEE